VKRLWWQAQPPATGGKPAGLLSAAVAKKRFRGN